jgi:hypothetical protein
MGESQSAEEKIGGAGLFMRPDQSLSVAKPKSQPEFLRGWKQIAEFLGEPSSVVQRWADTGLPAMKEVTFVTT